MRVMLKVVDPNNFLGLSIERFSLKHMNPVECPHNPTYMYMYCIQK